MQPPSSLRNKTAPGITKRRKLKSIDQSQVPVSRLPQLPPYLLIDVSPTYLTNITNKNWNNLLCG